MATSLPAIAILGAGHMGGAIARGLVHSGIELAGVRVTTASLQSAKALAATGIEAQSLEENPLANQWATEGAEIVVLGVKPRYVLDLLGEVAPFAPNQAMMVSVAAGITLTQMATRWPGAVVRTMPNTPAEIGKGVTGVAFGPAVSPAQQAQVRTLFGAIGEVLVVGEDSMNSLSAFSGSGPAFVYFFIERFIEVALEHGFSDQEAQRMVLGTVHGALELLARSGSTPEQLREAVTSPGGSTEAALKVFREADLAAIIRTATDHAIRRAGELAAG